ncbi:MAG: hypothetical protein J6B45_00030 [Clostridia bacterium]|nr:hypothetical protein [Clostridia bacterium]
MKRVKALFVFFLILSTLLPVFSSCGECQHTWDEGYIAKEATELEEGYSVHTCTKCKETTSREIPKLPHTKHDYQKTQWGSDETDHWLICDFKDCNATTGKHTHTWVKSSKGGEICQICKRERP